MALFEDLRSFEPRSPSEQAAYSEFLDERSHREDARADRSHSTEGVIPAPLWIVLFLSAATLFVFMIICADSGDHAILQATMMGGVAVCSRHSCCCFGSSIIRIKAAPAH